MVKKQVVKKKAAKKKKAAPVAVTTAATADSKAVIGKPFQPGQSGNPAGRPKGAKHLLSEQFLSMLQEDWALNGKNAIAAMRAEDPGAYVRCVASLIPKELKIDGEIEHTHEHRAVSAIDARIAELLGFGEGRDIQASLPH